MDNVSESTDKSVLYITYDGLLEPLGQSQVLAYLRELSADRTIHIISFEKAEDWGNRLKRDALASDISSCGIHWYPLRYHKKPSAVATAWDILIGSLYAMRLSLKHKIKIIHARSYVAGVMALPTRRMNGSRFVFDIRGFWADERIEGGIWHADSRLFKVAKWFEKRLFLSSDHIVTLTQASKRIIQSFDYLDERCPPISVIPTCADLDRFKPLEKINRDDSFVLGYVGTVGTWYMFNHVARTFKLFLETMPNGRILIVNRNEHDLIRHYLSKEGVSLDAVELTSANYEDMPLLINRMDASVFYIKQTFSKQASAPTKLAELLGCGVPCLSNFGVGDMADILIDENVGVAIDQFDDQTLLNGLNQIMQLTKDPALQTRCVYTANKYFSLDHGVEMYSGIYDAI